MKLLCIILLWWCYLFLLTLLRMGNEPVDVVAGMYQSIRWLYLNWPLWQAVKWRAGISMFLQIETLVTRVVSDGGPFMPKQPNGDESFKEEKNGINTVGFGLWMLGGRVSVFLKWIAYWENVDWVISSQLHLDLSVKLIFFAIFVLSTKDFRVFINVKPSHWPFPLQEMYSILCHYSCYFSERVKKYFLSCSMS